MVDKYSLSLCQQKKIQEIKNEINNKKYIIALENRQNIKHNNLHLC